MYRNVQSNGSNLISVALTQAITDGPRLSLHSHIFRFIDIALKSIEYRNATQSNFMLYYSLLTISRHQLENVINPVNELHHWIWHCMKHLAQFFFFSRQNMRFVFSSAFTHFRIRRIDKNNTHLFLIGFSFAQPLSLSVHRINILDNEWCLKTKQTEKCNHKNRIKRKCIGKWCAAKNAKTFPGRSFNRRFIWGEGVNK